LAPPFMSGGSVRLQVSRDYRDMLAFVSLLASWHQLST
jgi:hypothetical protein